MYGNECSNVEKIRRIIANLKLPITDLSPYSSRYARTAKLRKAASVSAASATVLLDLKLDSACCCCWASVSKSAGTNTNATRKSQLFLPSPEGAVWLCRSFSSAVARATAPPCTANAVAASADASAESVLDGLKTPTRGTECATVRRALAHAMMSSAVRAPQSVKATPPRKSRKVG